MSQTVGRDVLYTWRGDSRYKTGRRNKLALGSVVAKLGEDYSHPFKVGGRSTVTNPDSS